MKRNIFAHQTPRNVRDVVSNFGPILGPPTATTSGPRPAPTNHGLSCCHGPKLGIQPAKMCIRSAEMDRNGGSTGKNVQIQTAKNWIRGVKNGDNGI